MGKQDNNQNNDLFLVKGVDGVEDGLYQVGNVVTGSDDWTPVDVPAVVARTEEILDRAVELGRSRPRLPAAVDGVRELEAERSRGLLDFIRENTPIVGFPPPDWNGLLEWFDRAMRLGRPRPERIHTREYPPIVTEERGVAVSQHDSVPLDPMLPGEVDDLHTRVARAFSSDLDRQFVTGMPIRGLRTTMPVPREAFRPTVRSIQAGQPITISSNGPVATIECDPPTIELDPLSRNHEINMSRKRAREMRAAMEAPF